MKLDVQNRIEMLSVSRFAAQASNTAAASLVKDRLGDALQKQIQDLQQGLERPSRFTDNAKQSATTKAQMLKQRLEMLEEMLLHASPEFAKSLARELKSIAHELASLARNIGGSSTRSAATTENTSAEAVSQTTSAEIDSAAIDGANKNPDTETAGHEGKLTRENQASVSDKDSDSSIESDDRDGAETALRAALLDARKLLKRVIEQIKAKINLGDKEARRDLEAAEKNLDKLDQSLANGSGSSFYTESGAAGVTSSMGSGLLVSAGLSGIRIDVSI